MSDEKEKQQAEDDALNAERQKRFGPGPSGTGPDGFKGAVTGRFTGSGKAASDPVEVDKRATTGPSIPDSDPVITDLDVQRAEFAKAQHKNTLPNIMDKSGPLPGGLRAEEIQEVLSEDLANEGGPMEGLEPAKSHDGPPPVTEMPPEERDPVEFPSHAEPMNVEGQEQPRIYRAPPADGVKIVDLEQKLTVDDAVRAQLDRKTAQAEQFARQYGDENVQANISGHDGGPGRTEPISERMPPLSDLEASGIDPETVTKKAAQCGSLHPEVAAYLSGFEGATPRHQLKMALVDHADSHALDVFELALYRMSHTWGLITSVEVFNVVLTDTLAKACEWKVTPERFRAMMIDLIAFVWNRLDLDYNIPQADFFRAILIEFAHQMDKWGEDFDAKNTANDWVACVVIELNKSNLANEPEKALNGLVKVATLGYAGAIASIRLGGPAPRHYDAPPADPSPLVEAEEKAARQEYGEGGFPIAR